MIEGLFWAAVIGAVVLVADYFTTRNPEAKKKKQEDYYGWFDGVMLKLFGGVAVFFAIGYLFF